MESISTAAVIVERMRRLIGEPDFLERHRVNHKVFTRRRHLRFDVVMLLILQKTLKSIQLHLREFFAVLGEGAQTVTAGAWTQARAKLRHTAFIELNKAVMVETFYSNEDQPVELWHGHRMLAIDSSTLRLPNTAAVFEHFGGQVASKSGVRVPHARLSVLHDCLNWIGIDAVLGGFEQGEVALAGSHLQELQTGDVVLADRGYAGYLFLARISARGAHFIVRCPTNSFAAANALYERDRDGGNLVVNLPATPSCRKQAKAEGLPLEFKVRFVSVRLPTGQLEVLASSLLDEKDFPARVFLEAYARRWSIETYYHQLKNTLELENFSGQSVEAVLQDIHAAVFLSNLESVISAEASSQLPKAGEQGRLHGTKINKAVSFHALKSRVIDLLLGADPPELVINELRTLFLANPISLRPHRKPPRIPPSPLRSLNFQKRVRKIIF
jgi:hypothetical protein